MDFVDSIVYGSLPLKSRLFRLAMESLLWDAPECLLGDSGDLHPSSRPSFRPSLAIFLASSCRDPLHNYQWEGIWGLFLPLSLSVENSWTTPFQYFALSQTGTILKFAKLMTLRWYYDELAAVQLEHELAAYTHTHPLTTASLTVKNSKFWISVCCYCEFL